MDILVIAYLLHVAISRLPKFSDMSIDMALG